MFCDKLKELRKEKNLTQEELAKKVFISRSLIAKYETGVSYPNKENLEKLALFFNVEINDLIDTNETTLEVINSKNISDRVNCVCLLTSAIFSLLMAIFIFIPVFQGKRYVYLEGENNRVVEHYLASIFTGTYNYGSYLWLILLFTSIITSAFGIVSIIFRHKKYGPFLSLANYLILVCNIVFYFVCAVFCIAYINYP